MNIIGKRFICVKENYIFNNTGSEYYNFQGTRKEIEEHLEQYYEKEFEIGMITPKIIESKFDHLICFELEDGFKFLGILKDVFFKHFKELTNNET